MVLMRAISQDHYTRLPLTVTSHGVRLVSSSKEMGMGTRVVWMKNGTLPVAALILEVTGNRARIRTMRGTMAIDLTVKLSSLQAAE